MSFRLITAFMLSTAIVSCGGGGGDGGPTDPVDTTAGSVPVTPGNVALSSLGATSQLSASATSTSGVVPGTTFAWASVNTAIVSVDGNGLVTVVANGTTTVTAPASGTGVSGSASVTVAQTASTSPFLALVPVVSYIKTDDIKSVEI